MFANQYKNVLLAVTMLLGLTSHATAAEFTIKVSQENPATHPKGVWLEDFKREVETNSKNRIRVEVFHQGQLYKSERDGVEGAVTGLIQMAVPSTGYLGSILPQLEVVDLPMLFPTQDSFYKFQDSKVGTEILDMVKSRGLTGIGFVSNVPLELFSRTKITVPTDMKGKKIRAHSALVESSVAALGGNPISMRAGELFLALEQGIVDGAFTPVTAGAAGKYHEVTPYLLRLPLSAIVYIAVINSRFWSGLPQDLQLVVQGAAKAASQKNRVELAGLADKAVSDLKAGGITVIEPSPGQLADWQKLLDPVYSKYSSRFGAELIEKVRASSR